jgi:hypothetical protein
LLLVALFPAASGSISSDTNREAVHHFTWGADLVLFGFLIWYVAKMAGERKVQESSISRWGPLAVLSIGCFLLLLDPTRHVLLDHGGVFFQQQTLAMYSGPGQLSATGVACQWFSICGMVFMVAGIMWHMRMPETFLKMFASDNKAL